MIQAPKIPLGMRAKRQVSVRKLLNTRSLIQGALGSQTELLTKNSNLSCFTIHLFVGTEIYHFVYNLIFFNGMEKNNEIKQKFLS